MNYEYVTEEYEVRFNLCSLTLDSGRSVDVILFSGIGGNDRPTDRE